MILLVPQRGIFHRLYSLVHKLAHYLHMDASTRYNRQLDGQRFSNFPSLWSYLTENKLCPSFSTLICILYILLLSESAFEMKHCSVSQNERESIFN